jgi:iron complex outermembrane recepter protein
VRDGRSHRYDIESIKVLKGPADTGIYGMRGANGVILITTKRPGKRP